MLFLAFCWSALTTLAPWAVTLLCVWKLVKRPVSRFWMERRIRKKQSWLPRRFNTYNIEKGDYEHTGMEPTRKEVEAEEIKPILGENYVDDYSIWGSDEHGNSIILRVARKKDRSASVWLILDFQGKRYLLPGHPDSMAFNLNPKTIEAAGLKFEVLEPMRKWRITFNGFLRNADDVFCVKMNFIWTAMSAPFDCRRDGSAKLWSRGELRKDTDIWEVLCRSELDGYTQYGVLDGIIQLPDEKPMDVYFRGVRTHRWGCEDNAKLKSRTVLLGTLNNGMFFSLTQCSYANGGATRLTTGHILLPTCNLYPIDNLHQLSIITDNNLGYNAFIGNIEFTANGKKYEVSVRAKCPTMSIRSGRPWNLDNRIQLTSCTVNGKYTGSLVIINRKIWDHECPVPTEKSCLYLEEPMVKISEVPLTSDFDNIISQCSKFVGGKGASLAMLRRVSEGQFKVASGFCITTNAFQKQLEANQELQSQLQSVVETARGNPDQLHDVCQRTMSMISSTPVCDVVKNEIISAMKAFPADSQVAVRSSAVGEDSEELSAAGQNDTFLGVKGIDSVLEAVQKCWASPYSFRSVTYRKDYGQEVIVPMSVVIQKMVPAEVAGVLFTKNPVTGSPGEMHITANYGLAETVVSGTAEPDTIIIERSWDDYVKVGKKINGSKKLKIILSESGGCEEVELGESSELSLPDESALKLAKASILLEKHYGHALDIEWAFANDTLYLLQARPISSLSQWSDEEIKRELDAPVISHKELYTKANTGEVLPQATTPLSVSVTVKMLDMSIQYNTLKADFGNAPYEVSVYFNRFVVPFKNHAFINMLDTLLRVNMKDKLSFSQNAMGITVFGHAVFTQEMIDSAVDRFGIISRKKMLNLMKRMYESLFQYKQFVKMATKKYGNFQVPTDGFTTSKSLFSEIKSKLSGLIEITEIHSRISESASTSQAIITQVIVGRSEEFKPEVLSDVSQILSANNKVITTEVPRFLQKVAEALVESGESDSFVALKDEEKVKYLRTNSGKAGKQFQEFLDTFGHHGPREFDLGIPSWSDDPTQPVNTVTALLSTSSFKQERNENKNAEALQRLLKPSSWIGRILIRLLVRKAQKLVGCRERTKTKLVYVVHQFRKAYRQLGHLMVQEGYLPEQELINFMTHWEIGILLNERSPGIIRKAKIRRRIHKELEDLQFAEIVEGVPKPVSRHVSHGNTPSIPLIKFRRTGATPLKVKQKQYLAIPSMPIITDGSMVLRATPASCGVTKGIARVVVHLCDAHQIQRGDILITNGTNIGWTPYFAIISGVVTELGGTLSHGTVVARDHGIPCIVGATGATAMFKSGDLVLLNGNDGTISKIDNED